MGSQADLWFRYKKHFEYVHPESGAQVELHWRAFNNAEFGPLEVDRPDLLLLSGTAVNVRVLPRHELLLNLCLHGASHAWFRLKWLADIASLLGQETSESLLQLIEMARSRDLDRPVSKQSFFATNCFLSPYRPPESIFLALATNLRG